MSIELYDGTPGSGKSLHMARDIYNKLRFGGNVVANFNINRTLLKNKKGKKTHKGKFFYFDNKYLNVKLLFRYAEKIHKKNPKGQFYEAQTLLFIDECSLQFNSREYDRKDRMEWIKFFQHHRKLGFNVILTTQSDRLIDRQIRTFVENECKHRKLNHNGIIGVLLSILNIQLFTSVTYWYHVREKTAQEYFLYKKKYGEFYDTSMMFS